MVILGLTGSIGMGKSMAAAMFGRCGAAVFDADAAVHALMGAGGDAVAAVAEEFPGTVADGTVDRAMLGERVFGDPRATARLEALLHPRVRERETAFLERAAAQGARLAVLDVPLLLETGGEKRCDAVAVVLAPAFVQARRVLGRPGMTPGRFAAVRARQMSDHEKLRRADFVIPTGLGRATALRHVRRIVRMLAGRRGRHWPCPVYWPRRPILGRNP